MENINIPASALKEGTCACGCQIFDQLYKISWYKGLLSKGETLVNMIPIIVCKACGEAWVPSQQPIDPKQRDLFV